MARVLVAEPDPDVLAFIERAVAGWGHDPVRFRRDAELADVDVMILEPGMGARVLAAAQVLASRRPPVPLVVASIYPAEPGMHELRPVAYLLKPFSLGQLEQALSRAVRRSERRD